MKEDVAYRHENKHATYDIHVAKVQYKDDKRTDIIYWFKSRITGMIVCYQSFEATIPSEDLKYWTQLDED